MKKIIIILLSLIALVGCGNKEIEQEQTNKINNYSMQNKTNGGEKMIDYHKVSDVLSELDKISTKEKRDGYYWYEDLCINVRPSEQNPEMVDYISVISRDRANPNHKSIDIISEIVQIKDLELIQRLKDIMIYESADISQKDKVKYNDVLIDTADTESGYKSVTIYLEN